MANLSLLTTVMSANEAVLAADTAHIHTAEAGAIEFSGHKILTVRSKDGKILPEVSNGFAQTSKNQIR